MKGQTIVELIVALGFAAIFIVAIMSLVAHSLSNATFARLQTESDRYASETSEWLMGQRNDDWDVFYAHAGTWCMPSLSWSTQFSCGSDNTIIDSTGARTNFYREVTLTSVSTSEMSVRVSVSWTDGKGLHETTLNSTLTKWR